MAARMLSPKSNSPSHDLVETPVETARIVVKSLNPTGRILEPCCGLQQNFVTALSEGLRKGDTVAWCEIQLGLDFFDWHSPVDWIVTNPPWSKFRTFMNHACTLANDVVFIATMTHFMTRARLKDLDDAGFGLKRALFLIQPPAPWPTSGFQLAAVHVQKGWDGGLMLDRSALST